MTHLWLGKPRPKIPEPPFETATLLVSLTAANIWLPMDRPATVTWSITTGPLACEPVVESPYCKFTLAPVDTCVELL